MLNTNPIPSLFKLLAAFALCASLCYVGCDTPKPIDKQDGLCYITENVGDGSVKDKLLNKARREIRQAYYCDEIIVWPDQDDSKMRPVYDTLTALGFVKKDSCECLEGIQLWGLQTTPPQDFDLLGIVKGVKAKISSSGSGQASVSANYALDLDLQREANDNFDGAGPTLSVPSGYSSVIVGVIDGGVNRQHVLLKDVSSADTCGNAADSNGHGTHVSGVVANWNPNGKNRAFVPQCTTLNCNLSPTVLSVKVTRGDSSKGSLFQAVCGMLYAVKHGARVLNLSWGFRSKEQPALLKIFADLHPEVLLVAAAGNDSLDLDQLQTNDSLLFWPASLTATCSNVLSVAACDTAGNYAPFSNRSNRYVDLLAPGVGIWSAESDDNKGIIEASGTSMAAPFVSRAAALYWAKKPSLRASDVKKGLIGFSNNRVLIDSALLKSCCP
jgi:subtilisin family serine protease